MKKLLWSMILSLIYPMHSYLAVAVVAAAPAATAAVVAVFSSCHSPTFKSYCSLYAIQIRTRDPANWFVWHSFPSILLCTHTATQAIISASRCFSFSFSPTHSFLLSTYEFPSEMLLPERYLGLNQFNSNNSSVHSMSCTRWSPLSMVCKYLELISMCTCE